MKYFVCMVIASAFVITTTAFAELIDDNIINELAWKAAKTQSTVKKEGGAFLYVGRYNNPYENGAHVSVLKIWAPGTSHSRTEAFNFLIVENAIARSEETRFFGLDSHRDESDLKRVALSVARDARRDGYAELESYGYIFQGRAPRDTRRCDIEVAVLLDFQIVDLGIFDGCSDIKEVGSQ